MTDNNNIFFNGKLPENYKKSVVNKPTTEKQATITPIAEATPTVETTKVGEITPKVETTPIAETTPVNESTPTVDTTPVNESTPTVDTTPVDENTPTVETAPMVENTPAEETAPIEVEVPEKTKEVDSELGGKIVEAKPYVKRNPEDKAVFFERTNVQVEQGLNSGNSGNNGNEFNSCCNKKAPKNFVSRTLSIVLSAIILVLVFVVGFTSSAVFNSSDVAVASWVADQVNDRAYFAENEVSPFDIMVNGIGGVMNDPYAKLFYPEELQQSANESKGNGKGVGMSVAQYVDLEGIYVAGVTKGSPADKSGMQENWRILSVNGVDLTNGTIEQLTTLIGAIPDDEKFTMVFATPDPNGNYNADRTKELDDLEKANYTPIVVEYFDNSSPVLDNILDDDTAYIVLSSFVGDVEAQFDDAMETFKKNGKTNLILDLRNNGGGSDFNLQGVAKHLITDEKDSKHVPILKEKYKDGSERVLETEENLYDDYNFGEIIVLVNENSASASEALLLAMIDYETVDLVIGMPTYGKGTGLSTITMPATGYGVRFTVSYFFSPYGNSNEKVGIQPTAGYMMEDKVGSPYIYYSDDILMRAIDSLI